MDNSRVPLRRNRDFNLLWTGQAVSDLGTRVFDIAFPLLVLATTGSPGRAGIVGFAGTLPLFVFSLFAGALVDRANRKRLMIVCDLVRSLAFASLVVAILAGSVTFGHIVVVAFIEGTGYVFFSVAERSALRQVVTDDQLPDALAQPGAGIHVAARRQAAWRHPVRSRSQHSVPNQQCLLFPFRLDALTDCR